jgi:hypothetical protein
MLASRVFAGIRSILDDDNSGRYNETNDLAPVVNLAVGYLITIFNAAFEQKKLSPESLRELIRVDVLPVTGTGNTKKCDVSSVMDHLWSMLGVEPSPEVHFSGGGLTTTTLAPDAFFETRNKLATRLTIEEWNDRKEDPFSPGCTVSIPSTFARAAYLGPGKYFNPTDDYIMIRPATLFTNDYVGIWYLKDPTFVTRASDVIEFPQSLFNLLVEKSVNFLSLQQGPESKLGPVTDKEVIQLITLMNS